MIAIVDGNDWDLSRPIEADATVALVTAKDEVALALLRHGCAHVMAEAVLSYFRKLATIGPPLKMAYMISIVPQFFRR